MLAACADGPPPGDEGNRPQRPVEVREQTLHSGVKLRADATIGVENRWGDIRVRSNDRAGVRVKAFIQRIGENPPPQPALRVSEDRDRFRLKVAFAGAQRDPRTGRVDLVVYAPPGNPLELATRDGRIQVKKTTNPVRARSRSGQILVINDGSIDAHSRSGEVHVRPIRPGWRMVKAESGSGRVRASLPDDAELDIVVDAAEITSSEFELRPTRDGKKTLQRGNARDVVRLRTNGPAELIRITATTEQNPRQSD